MRYARILAAVAGTPWAIEPVKGRAIIEFLSFAAAGGRRTPGEIAEITGRPLSAIDANLGTITALSPGAARRENREDAVAAEQRAIEDRGGVAIVGLKGVISPRLSDEMDLSGGGGTSAEGFAKRLEGALNDPRVGGVIVDVDSPGGNVLGIKEATDALYRARSGDKPVVAVASPFAASAAYWIAASAAELVVTPSGEVGSIGVYTWHEDLSQALETAGVKISLVTSDVSPHKAETHPAFALSDEARGDLQEGVNRYGRSFAEAVARGRGVAVDDVVARFGGGRMLGAEEALKRGMVDRIATLDDEIRRMSAALTKPAKAKRGAMASARRRAALW